MTRDIKECLTSIRALHTKLKSLFAEFALQAWKSFFPESKNELQQLYQKIHENTQNHPENLESILVAANFYVDNKNPEQERIQMGLYWKLISLEKSYLISILQNVQQSAEFAPNQKTALTSLLIIQAIDGLDLLIKKQFENRLSFTERHPIVAGVTKESIKTAFYSGFGWMAGKAVESYVCLPMTQALAARSALPLIQKALLAVHLISKPTPIVTKATQLLRQSWSFYAALGAGALSALAGVKNIYVSATAHRERKILLGIYEQTSRLIEQSKNIPEYLLSADRLIRVANPFISPHYKPNSLARRNMQLVEHEKNIPSDKFNNKNAEYYTDITNNNEKNAQEKTYANLQLGKMHYLNLESVAKNTNVALLHFREAARSKDEATRTEALLYIGQIYFIEKCGIEDDITQAPLCFEKAALCKSNAYVANQAFNFIQELAAYAEDDNTRIREQLFLSTLLGNSPSEKQRKLRLLKTVSRQLINMPATINALVCLGKMHMYGKEITKNILQAELYLEKAKNTANQDWKITQEGARAYLALGEFYILQNNIAKAKEYFTTILEKHNSPQAHTIAQAFLEKLSSPELANAQPEIILESVYALAHDYLGELYYQGAADSCLQQRLAPFVQQLHDGDLL